MLLASLLMLVRWLVSTISGIIVVASLPSAVDAVMFLVVSASVGLLHAVAGSPLFASIPAFDGVYTVLAVLFLLSFLLLPAFLLL